MIVNHIKYGGALKVGDFIGIGSNCGMTFGWYSGNGKSGNIQFISAYDVIREFNDFKARMNNKSTVSKKSTKDIRGFSFDHLSKHPLRGRHVDRAVKITCPDDVFTGLDLQRYLEAKRILIDMKFIKP